MNVLRRNVNARGQTGLIEQAWLRCVRELNAVYLDPDMTRSLHDVDALSDGTGVGSASTFVIGGRGRAGSNLALVYVQRCFLKPGVHDGRDRGAAGCAEASP